MLVSTKSETVLCDTLLIPKEWYGTKICLVKYIPKLDDGKILYINLTTVCFKLIPASDWGHIDLPYLLAEVSKANQICHNFLSQQHYTLPENFKVNTGRYKCLWSMEIHGMNPCNFASGDDCYICTYNSENNVYYLWELR